MPQRGDMAPWTDAAVLWRQSQGRRVGQRGGIINTPPAWLPGNTVTPGSPEGPTSPNNIGRAVNANQFLNGWSNYTSVAAPWTMTLAAGNNSRVEQVFDLGSTLRALQSADTTQNATMGNYKVHMTVSAAQNGILVPFFVVGENGLTITSTDANSNSISVPIQSSISADDHGTVYGPAVELKSRWDNGTLRWQRDFNFNLSKLARQYLRNYSIKEIDEENYLECKIGILVRGQATNQFTLNMTSIYDYTLAPRNFVPL